MPVLFGPTAQKLDTMIQVHDHNISIDWWYNYSEST